MNTTNIKPDFILGLDLGHAQDYTALAILERRASVPEPTRRPVSDYLMRHLQRWPLKTPYPQIVAEVAELVQKPPLSNPMLAVDQTEVGEAIVDMLRHALLKACLNPILITNGHEITRPLGTWHVPKKELVSTVQKLLQTRRLKFAMLSEREQLLKELHNFRVKVTLNANETFDAWRERDHDDMVLAVALAAWLGEERGPAFVADLPVIDTPRLTVTQRVFGRSLKTWP